MNENKPVRIGISSCLLCEEVRYDGGHKLDRFLTETLGQLVDYVPVCPEVECGLGVPREPMHLAGDPENPRLVTNLTGIDFTEQMILWTEKRVQEFESEDLAGFIFKSRSPSCGMERVDVIQENGQFVKACVGIFARMLMENFPHLPVEDESSLGDPEVRTDFIEAVFADKEDFKF